MVLYSLRQRLLSSGSGRITGKPEIMSFAIEQMLQVNRRSFDLVRCGGLRLR
jgi:hypothetical protein